MIVEIRLLTTNEEQMESVRRELQETFGDRITIKKNQRGRYDDVLAYGYLNMPEPNHPQPQPPAPQRREESPKRNRRVK